MKLIPLVPLTGRSLWFYRWTVLLLLLGVATASAVIVGALLVGDSVRGSLRGLVLDRLGRIEFLLASPRFLHQSITDRLQEANDFPSRLAAPVPAMLFNNGTAEHLSKTSDIASVHRATSVLVMGIDSSYWEMGDLPVAIDPQWDKVANRVILNQQLATELQASVGSSVILRLPAEQTVPADSPLGEREDLVTSLPVLKVVAIVPNAGLARFGIHPSQAPPMNAFVDLAYLQRQLDREEQINAVLLARKKGEQPLQRLDQANAAADSLAKQMQFDLSDFGLRFERIQSQPAGDAPTGAAFDYYHLTSQQLLLMPDVVEAVSKSLPKDAFQPVLTYLSNDIRKIGSNGEAEGVIVPYSTISAIDSGATFPLQNRLPEIAWQANSLPTGHVVINQWLADQLQAKVGDRLEVLYYLPETVHGQEVEQRLEVTVAGVVPLSTPSRAFLRKRPAKYDRPLTLFNDPDFTPEVPGITDQDSISDIEVPFKLKPTIRDEDDQYWNNYRLTPKMFISLADGQKAFGSRFGNVSSLRISPSIAADQAAIEQMLLPQLRAVANRQGLAVMPIYAQHWQAASGTTPFDVLFLSLSFFVIIAALLLVSLLFRLAIEQRSAQWGLLLSVGWSSRQVLQLVIREGLITAGAGALLGVLLGIAYAKLMILGLSGWWVGAIRVAFLEFHSTWLSLLIGYGASCLAVWATMRWTARSLSKSEVLWLLRSVPGQGNQRSLTRRGVLSQLPWLLIPLSLALFAMGPWLVGEARAGCFLGGGMLLVVACVLRLRSWLYARATATQPLMAVSAAASNPARMNLGGLAMNSIRRNPLRSLLAVSMIAFASFLVLAISLFQARPSRLAQGGYQLQGQTSIAIPKNIGKASVLQDVFGDEAAKLESSFIGSFRLRPGDDASCSNLYQASQPRVLGVTSEFVDHDAGFDSASPKEATGKAGTRFPWAAASKPNNDRERATPFALLEAQGDGSQSAPFPVILDMNTAMWSLHRGAAVGEQFSFRYEDQEIWFQTVAILQNSLLQGCLMMSEQNFGKAFPTISGYQFFLIEVKAAQGEAEVTLTRDLLEKGWGDQGMDVIETEKILAQLQAVQNTYLSAFQALGALGLLLGTFGLAVVQTRSVYERRHELAILRALGFSQARLGNLLFLENAWLLGLGISIGVGSALIAVMPAWWLGQPLGTTLGPLVMLLLVLIVGLVSGGIAVWRSVQLPLLGALRSAG